MKRKYSAPSISLLKQRKDTQFVNLRDVLTGAENKGTSNSPLNFALGKAQSGQYTMAPLSDIEHLLIGGAAGTGKSVFINALITSLLYKWAPWELRLCLIDPKKTEFAQYKGLPHVLGGTIIESDWQAINSLQYLKKQIELRQTLLSDSKHKSIVEYNKAAHVAKEFDRKMPYIVLVVDEFADLMLSGKEEFENLINHIAQRGSNVGIHLVLATATTDSIVLSGTIKAGIGGRVSFWVPSSTDSRNILDSSGAENLLGHGNMLYSSGVEDPVEMRGAYVSLEEIRQIVERIRTQNESGEDTEYLSVVNALGEDGKMIVAASSVEEDDPLLADVLKAAITSNGISIGFVQQKFALGYARASTILEQLEEKGYITALVAGSAQVVMTQGEFCALYQVDPDSFEQPQKSGKRTKKPSVQKNSQTVQVIKSVEPVRNVPTEVSAQAKISMDALEEAEVLQIKESMGTNLQSLEADIPEKNAIEERATKGYIASMLTEVQDVFTEAHVPTYAVDIVEQHANNVPEKVQAQSAYPMATEAAFAVTASCAPIPQTGARIRVVHAGNTAMRLTKNLCQNVPDYIECIAVDTDVVYDHQNGLKSSYRALKSGFSDSEFGKKSIVENDLLLIQDGIDAVFVVAQLGSGTGGGAAAPIAGFSKKEGLLTLAFAVMPFEFEGETRYSVAQRELNELQNNADVVIKINPNTLIASHGTVSIADAYAEIEKTIERIILSFSRLIAFPGFIDPDFGEIYAALSNKGIAHFGLGEATGANRVEKALAAATDCQFLGTGIEGAKHIILHIVGGSDLSLGEIALAQKTLKESAQEARITLAADSRQDEAGIKIMLIATK